MQATDYSSTTSFGRSILSLRRDQVHSMDSTHDFDYHLESFQRHVTDKFSDLVSEELLSLNWIRKILESFLSCQEEFYKILNYSGDLSSRPPLDRMIGDYLERSVKALDVCNAIRDGIEQIREWKKLIEIVLCALGDDHREKFLGEGQFRRAKKALIDLSISMLDEKESAAALAHRNRSFGRQKEQAHHHRSLGHFRSLSWSVSRSWSAARQLQAIANNLVPPKTNDVVATNGMAIAVFTMSTILLFVMWVLVAAIPCQDRGLQVHFAIPRHFPWAAHILAVHERVLEESKKRDRKNASGLLKEIYLMDKCARVITDFADSVQFPLSEEKEKDVRLRVTELRSVCDWFKEGLDPLERQIREVFHRIVHSRTHGLDSLGRANHHE